MGQTERMRERLSAAQRLRESDDFQHVYAGRTAIHTPAVTVCYCKNGNPLTRMGVSVSRKNGGAVQRNRIKRVLRAAFRQCQTELPGGLDLVLIPKRGVENWTTALAADMLRQAARKLRAKEPRP